MKRFVFLSLLFTFLTVNAYSQAKQFLCIDVTPSNATLEINGVIKETNNGEYEELLPLGTYNYKVSRDGYSTATGVVDISDPNKKYSFKINLKKPYGYLHVQKPDMPDLQFFIDDKEIDAAEVDHITLPSGIHHLTILHPLCKIYHTIVAISDETNTTIKPVLEQINIYTTLTTSENAEIYVNGEYKGIGTCRKEYIVVKEQRDIVVKPYDIRHFQHIKVCKADENRKNNGGDSEYGKEKHIGRNHYVSDPISLHFFPYPLCHRDILTSNSLFFCCFCRHL